MNSSIRELEFAGREREREMDEVVDLVGEEKIMWNGVVCFY